MKTFEYKKTPALSEERLSEYGKDGWELVATVPELTLGITIGATYILKREITTPQKN